MAMCSSGPASRTSRSVGAVATYGASRPDNAPCLVQQSVSEPTHAAEEDAPAPAARLDGSNQCVGAVGH